jgi:hypothetical protein
MMLDIPTASIYPAFKILIDPQRLSLLLSILCDYCVLGFLVIYFS